MDLFSQLRTHLNDALHLIEENEESDTIKESILNALEVLDELAPCRSDPLDFNRGYDVEEDDDDGDDIVLRAWG